MSSQAQALRELLEQRFPGATPVGAGSVAAVPSGVAALDGILPGGGFPRGRLSVWGPGVGATAVLRSACLEAAERGERSVWIDARHRLPAGVPWEGVSVLRPGSAREALASAEELLRSGGFGVVVLSGVASSGPVRVRLCRVAREGGSAFVELSEEGQMAAVRLVSRVGSDGYVWRRNRLGEPLWVDAVRVHVRATALGWSREAELLLPIASHAPRLSLEPSLVSRRGAAR